jgi:hypothetical protein
VISHRVGSAALFAIVLTVRFSQDDKLNSSAAANLSTRSLVAAAPVGMLGRTRVWRSSRAGFSVAFSRSLQKETCRVGARWEPSALGAALAMLARTVKLR